MFERNSGEHWAGKLYIRKLSPYLTRLFLRTPLTPERGHVADDPRRAASPRPCSRCPGVLPAIGAVLLIQLQILLDCTDGEMARWLDRSSPVGRLPRPHRPLPHRDAAADRARHPRRRRLGLDRQLHDARAGRGGAAAARQGRDGARARGAHGVRPAARARTRATVAAPRGGAAAAGCARLLRFAPFFRAFVAVEATLLALVAALDRLRARRPRRDARAAARARGRGGDHRGRPSGGDPHLEAPAMTPSFGCVVLTQGRRPADLRMALDSLLRQEGVDVDVVVVGNGWEPEGLPDGVRGVGLRRGRRHPGRAQRGRAARRAASCCSSSTTTPASWRPTRSRGSRARSPPSPARAGPAARRRRARAAPGRATGCRGCGRATATRPGDVTLVWEGAVAMPRARVRAGRRLAGEFRFVHEGVDLAWRVMDAGYRVALRGRPRGAPPAARAGRVEARLLALLRRAQPGLAGTPSSTIAARVRCTWRRSRCARCRCCSARPATCSRRCAVTGMACASPAASGARCTPARSGAWRAPGAPRDLMHRYLRDEPMTTDTETGPDPPASVVRGREAGRRRHQRETEWAVAAARLRAAPRRAAADRPVRARAVAAARVRARAVAHEPAVRSTSTRCSGRRWLVLNPLLLALVYFVLVDILRHGHRPPGFFAHLVAGIFAYYFVSGAVRDGVKSVTAGRQAGAEHGVPAHPAADVDA